MKEIRYCENCGAIIPDFDIQDGFRICMKYRKTCLKCLPYKPKKGILHCHCKVCGDENPDHFISGRLNICNKCETERNKKMKEKFVPRNKEIIKEELGTRCSCCGYDKYKSALEIHHVNKFKKSDDFKNRLTWSPEKLKKELKDCVLLCRNCHMAFHANKINYRDFDYTIRPYSDTKKQVIVCLPVPN